MNHSTLRHLYAAFEDRGVYVYQAFRPEIVALAVDKGTFGAGFTLDRMTWIKPSFGWMLHRCEYATKHRQEAVARICLSHEGFHTLLRQAIPTYYVPALFPDARLWSDALAKSDVRVQWDPDRDLRGRPLERRAIQIGLRGDVVSRYVNDWILGVEDVTPLAHAIGAAVRNRSSRLPVVSEERPYPLPPDIRTLIDGESTAIDD